jgi:hypothetical protein
MSGRFEVYKDSQGEYRFRLKASNGQTLLFSEGYSSKSGCMKGIESAIENSKVTERFETYEDKAGKYRFRLKAANNQIIGVSKVYEIKSKLQNGIKYVQRLAPEIGIKEI